MSTGLNWHRPCNAEGDTVLIYTFENVEGLLTELVGIFKRHKREVSKSTVSSQCFRNTSFSIFINQLFWDEVKRPKRKRSSN
ncbi:10251_t:CDS:2 [Diversispora eburnea]|uniref:10251_t:CDS:1 n=1 Tax=Diversispora eburnea TaxID=1213867 RepID=A0A9N8WKH4_9GLOM|nr:10251_t:CDS:2 [Diversispora eburnea]